MTSRPAALPAVVFVALAVLVGINGRASIGAFPPVLAHVSCSLALNGTTAGLMTTMTVVSMGIAAPLVQKLSAALDGERTLALTLAVLTAGGLLRLVAGSIPVFLASSALVGAGMGGTAVLMPSLIAHHVPRIRGLATGIYAMGLASGVALAAAIALPTEALLGGWQQSLAVWGAVAAAATVLWLLALPRLRAHAAPRAEAARAAVESRLPWRDPVAWRVTAFTTACMVMGFGGVAWVAPMYADLGVSEAEAAGYLVMFQVVQLATMLGLPWITDFTPARRMLLAISLLSAIAGLVMLIVAPLATAVPAVSLFGLGVGGGATMGLILIGDVTATPAASVALNAMVMQVAYPIGALTPLAIGFLHDVTGRFEPGFTVVLAVLLVSLVGVPFIRSERVVAVPAT
jgi:CP family cyanate transporter-like MFS transporter